MSQLWSTIKAFACGAGLMYWFDPESGPQRRSKMRRQLLEAAATTGDEVDRLLTVAGHKLAEQTGHVRSQVLHAVTGNGHHKADSASASGEPEPLADEPLGAEAVATKAAAACPFHQSRVLAGVGGTLLLAYGLKGRSPWNLVATALGVGLLTDAALRSLRADAAKEELSEPPRPSPAQDDQPHAAGQESRRRVAQP